MTHTHNKIAPKNAARVFRLDQLPLTEVRPGFARTGLRSDGAVTTVNWFEPGYRSIGPHAHPFDQLSYVLCGAMRFWVGDEVFDVQAPSVLYIPGGVPHCAEPLGDERALNVDVFAPLREDYLPLCEHQGFNA
ncbi:MULTISPECIES: cupin domain-containing protein [Pseudomonas]|uniref:Cupin domain-containing protein n=1 Tax=Pseudomonas citronellolis TaxID=53408 RepID=A0AAW6PA58_9PSED|nr:MULTISPECIES: cupin domain-containing protein [Pseudomonas]MDF3843520.1 cupin domain-containing protein [Pseudomonas citronellolis]